jgi:hypothetical protein
MSGAGGSLQHRHDLGLSAGVHLIEQGHGRRNGGFPAHGDQLMAVAVEKLGPDDIAVHHHLNTRQKLRQISPQRERTSFLRWESVPISFYGQVLAPSGPNNDKPVTKAPPITIGQARAIPDQPHLMHRNDCYTYRSRLHLSGSAHWVPDSLSWLGLGGGICSLDSHESALSRSVVVPVSSERGSA